MRIERNTARAWLRSGILAPIGEQCGMAHDIDALAVLMAGHSLLGVRPPFRVALENSALCKLSGCTPGITPSHQRLPAFARDHVLDVAIDLPDVAQTLMDHLSGAGALEPRSAIALNGCAKVRNRSIDLGGARASAVGKPIGKASARGSYCLAGRPRQNTIRNSQLAGGRQQAKRARDPLHLAVCTGCVLLGEQR